MKMEEVMSMKATREELLEKISTVTNSINDVDIDQELCPFCKSPQQLNPNEPLRKWRKYSYCTCEGMKRYLNDRRMLSNLEEKLKEIDLSITKLGQESRENLSSSGIGKRFLESTFENFDQNYQLKAYDIAYKYADSFDQCNGSGLIFTGNVGTGKTHLAAAIANHIVEKFMAKVEFVTFAEILAQIRAAFSDGSNKNIILEKKMCEADLLIIDDLGKENSSQFTNELFYRVVNYRYKEKLPLVITSNVRAENLCERYDYAVMSRLLGECKAVDMQGIDYRVKQFLKKPEQ